MTGALFVIFFLLVFCLPSISVFAGALKLARISVWRICPPRFSVHPINPLVARDKTSVTATTQPDNFSARPKSRSRTM